MKEVTTKYFCDYCGGEIIRRNAEIIESLSYQQSGYQDSGSGGITIKKREMCNICSKKFIDFMKSLES